MRNWLLITGGLLLVILFIFLYARASDKDNLNLMIMLFFGVAFVYGLYWLFRKMERGEIV